MSAAPGPATQRLIRSLAAHAAREWSSASTLGELARWVAHQVTPPTGMVPAGVADVLLRQARQAVTDAVTAYELGVSVPDDLPLRG